MFNKKALCLLICSTLVQGCGDSEQKSIEYLESGKSYYQNGNYDKAKLELKNALQINDKLTEAYLYLGFIGEKNKNWKAMYSNLMQTIKLDPENFEAKQKLAKLYLLSGELDKARTETDWLLTKENGNPDIIALNGTIHLKQGAVDKALSEAERALELDPSHVDSIGLLVGVYLSQQKYSVAEEYLNKALALNPDQMALNLLKLEVHIKSKDVEKVEQDYQSLMSLYPDKLEFNYALAKLYVGTDRYSAALKLLEDTVEKNPQDEKAKLVLVELLLLKDKAGAETTLKKYLEVTPDSSDLNFKLVNLYIEQNKQEEAKVALTRIVKKEGNNAKGNTAKVILAKFAIRQKEFTKASEWVQEVLDNDARHYEALLLQARIEVITGKYDDAIAKLRGILRDYSKSDEAMVLLGQAYVNKESPELAEENFRNAIDVNPGNFSAVMPVAARMIESKDLGRAEELLGNALKNNPDHEGAMQALAQVRLLQKDWEGAQEVANLIASRSSGQGYADYLSGKISQGQGNFKQAIEKYKNTLKINPSLNDALKSLAVCYASMNQSEAFITYLDEFIKVNPDQPYPALIKGEVLAQNNRLDQAETIFAQGMEKWPKVYQFYELSAKVVMTRKEIDKAISIYNKGLENLPNNEQLRLLLASLYEMNKQYDKAMDEYNLLLERQPNSNLAVNNLVSLLLEHKSGKQIEEKALNLSARFKTSKQPYFQDTYAWALFHNGKVEEAKSIFETLVKKMPDVAVFHFHLGTAYQRLNKNEEAIKSLEKALELGKNQKTEFLEQQKAEALIRQIKNPA